MFPIDLGNLVRRKVSGPSGTRARGFQPTCRINRTRDVVAPIDTDLSHFTQKERPSSAVTQGLLRDGRQALPQVMSDLHPAARLVSIKTGIGNVKSPEENVDLNRR